MNDKPTLATHTFAWATPMIHTNNVDVEGLSFTCVVPEGLDPVADWEEILEHNLALHGMTVADVSAISIEMHNIATPIPEPDPED